MNDLLCSLFDELVLHACVAFTNEVSITYESPLVITCSPVWTLCAALEPLAPGYLFLSLLSWHSCDIVDLYQAHFWKVSATLKGGVLQVVHLLCVVPRITEDGLRRQHGLHGYE